MIAIRGELSFEDKVVSLSGAAVYVRLIDVSLADAAARTVSEYRISSLPAGTNTSDRINFELAVDLAGSRGSYTLTAHIDLDRDGKASIGDYITMESFPISVQSPSTYYVVRVRRITR
jgi:uncharacterized lipoprotein YbaY